MAAERGEVLIWSRGGRKGAANEVVRAHSEEALFPETPRRAQKRFSKNGTRYGHTSELKKRFEEGWRKKEKAEDRFYG